MANNKLIIAAAGSGKTTHVVTEALKIKDSNILVTTFTEANEAEIRKRFIEKNKCVPANITIQTWFSFLIQHGAKPFRKKLFDQDITGLLLVNSQSAPFVEESDTKGHYFTDCAKIYSDKLAKFVLKCNTNSNGAVIDRLSRVYTYIFIDEVQDLAGCDLDFLKLLFSSKINMLLVGDPRQGTYSTNNARKNKKFRKSKIVSFFDEKSINITKDETSLIVNYRCVAPICEFSNRLFPDLPKTTSGNMDTPAHKGIFLVNKQDVPKYLKTFMPIQLRYDKKTVVDENYPVRTFGDSKGLTFNRVLIYPPKPFIDWLEDNTSDLAPTSRSKYYVAVTRARYSVGIVYDFTAKTAISGVEKYLSGNIENPA